MSTPGRGRPVTVEPPKESDLLYNLAHGAAYPLTILNVEKSLKGVAAVNLPVGPRVYAKVIEKYGTNELVIYFDPVSGNIQAWSQDVLITLRFMAELGAMSSTRSWVSGSGAYLNAYLEGKRGKPIASKTHKKIKAELRAILDSLDMVNDLDARVELVSIAKDVISSRVKDLDTAIYRIAMAIFHFTSYFGKEYLPALDEPARVYLKFVQNPDLSKRHSWLVEQLGALELEQRLKATKTLMSFIAAGYIVYAALSD